MTSDTISVFGHIARLSQGTPARNALHCQVGLASGRSLGGDWIETSSWSSSCSLGRPTPQRHWICPCQPLETSLTASPSRSRRAVCGAIEERRDATWRPELITRWRRRRPDTIPILVLSSAKISGYSYVSNRKGLKKLANITYNRPNLSHL